MAQQEMVDPWRQPFPQIKPFRTGMAATSSFFTKQALRNLPPGSRAQPYHTIIPPYFVNYLQSTSPIDAFEIVTILLLTVDPPTATLFLQLIQLINSLPLVFFCVFFANKRNSYFIFNHIA